MAEDDDREDTWHLADYKGTDGVMKKSSLVNYEKVQHEFEAELSKYTGTGDKERYGNSTSKINEAHYLVLTLAGDAIKNMGKLKLQERGALYTHYCLVLAKQLHTKTGRFGADGDLSWQNGGERHTFYCRSTSSTRGGGAGRVAVGSNRSGQRNIKSSVDWHRI